jgi:hypothetical protein
VGLPKVDGSSPSEAHALAIQEFPLELHPLAIAPTDAPRGIDDAVPRDDARERAIQPPERRADCAHGSGPAEHFGDLAVGGHFASRDPPHDAMNLAEKRRVRHRRFSSARGADP